MLNHLKTLSLSGVLTVFCLLYFVLPAWANDIIIPVGERNISVNGKPYTMDAPSFLEQGRLYVSSRSLANMLQADVKWQDKMDYQSITFNQNGHSVVFLIGNNNYLVKHREFYTSLEEMDAPPLLIGEVSYIPVRFLLENLGYRVSNDNNSLLAKFTGEFTKEGFVIPLESSLQNIKAYQADILLELVVENNMDLDKQMAEVKDILASQGINPLPVINEVSSYFSKGYVNTSYGLGDKVTVHGLGKGAILIRIWR